MSYLAWYGPWSRLSAKNVIYLKTVNLFHFESDFPEEVLTIGNCGNMRWKAKIHIFQIKQKSASDDHPVPI